MSLGSVEMSKDVPVFVVLLASQGILCCPGGGVHITVSIDIGYILSPFNERKLPLS